MTLDRLICVSYIKLRKAPSAIQDGITFKAKLTQLIKDNIDDTKLSLLRENPKSVINKTICAECFILFHKKER